MRQGTMQLSVATVLRSLRRRFLSSPSVELPSIIPPPTCTGLMVVIEHNSPTAASIPILASEEFAVTVKASGAVIERTPRLEESILPKRATRYSITNTAIVGDPIPLIVASSASIFPILSKSPMYVRSPPNKRTTDHGTAFSISFSDGLKTSCRINDSKIASSPMSILKDATAPIKTARAPIDERLYQVFATLDSIFVFLGRNERVRPLLALR